MNEYNEYANRLIERKQQLGVCIDCHQKQKTLLSSYDQVIYSLLASGILVTQDSIWQFSHLRRSFTASASWKADLHLQHRLLINSSLLRKNTIDKVKLFSAISRSFYCLITEWCHLWCEIQAVKLIGLKWDLIFKPFLLNKRLAKLACNR